MLEWPFPNNHFSVMTHRYSPQIDSSIQKSATRDLATQKYTLKVHCPDQKGLVAELTTKIFKLDGLITELDQFTDLDTAQFFMRIRFDCGQKLNDEFSEIFNKFKITGALIPEFKRPKVLLLCSKQGHCLNDILHKWHSGSLPIDIPAILSNHNDLEEMAKWYQIPFKHLPITKETKKQQEAEIEKIIESQEVDYIVLARYMQILSEEFCQKYSGKIINIHHSFLPGFKGARPYHQAFERGVKLIGATSHFVTGDLDEGPIICQETIRVNHSQSAAELTRHGADIEALVLIRGLRAVIENRVFIDGRKTVVLKS